MKTVLDFVRAQPPSAVFVLTKEKLDASLEEFHDAVCPFVDAGGGDGFVVLGTKSESQSGYLRHDGGIGRYIIVYCERVG